MNALVRCTGILALLFAFQHLGSERAEAVSPAEAGVGQEQQRPLAQAAKGDLNALSMEVLALQSCLQLQLTPAQLQALAKLAPETAMKARPRKPAQASDLFRKKLTELRAALIKRDGEEVGILVGELGEVTGKEKPALDNSVSITEPARRRAAEVLKLLAPRQVVLYAAGFENMLSDPAEALFLALEQGVKMNASDWKEFRDGLAAEVGELVAGMDPAASKKVSDRIGAVLDRGHKMNEADLKKNRPELEKQLRQIVEAAGPTDILRHFMERHLALLLSNPHLAAALDAQLKGAR